MANPLVSINIPTLDSARTLELCLSAVSKQTYENVETVLIDSYSSDETVAIAGKFGARIVLGRGLLMQRMTGIRASLGEFLLLLDSDQVAPPTLIESCVRKMQSDPSLGALIVPEVTISANHGTISAIQRTYHTDLQYDPHPLYGTALPRFFRTHLLKAVRPPRRELGYFDHAWIYRRSLDLGAKIGFVQERISHIESNSTYNVMRKFSRFYGSYLVPALLEDWRLVIGKTLPRRSVLMQAGDLTLKQQIDQFALYGLKAFGTAIGLFSSILRKSGDSQSFEIETLANS